MAPLAFMDCSRGAGVTPPSALEPLARALPRVIPIVNFMISAPLRFCQGTRFRENPRDLERLPIASPLLARRSGQSLQHSTKNSPKNSMRFRKFFVREIFHDRHHIFAEAGKGFVMTDVLSARGAHGNKRG